MGQLVIFFSVLKNVSNLKVFKIKRYRPETKRSSYEQVALICNSIR